MLGCLSAQGQTITETFGSGVNQFSIDFVHIGNPGNAADGNGLGHVNYDFRIGKYEVSKEQFLKASVGGVADMGYFGRAGANSEWRPATGVTWVEAARFVNFLNTNSGYQRAYKINEHNSLELWASSDYGYDSSNKVRNIYAKYFLPSTDEWYKSAFGNPGGAWHLFATGGDISPISVYDGTSGAVYQRPWNDGPAMIFDAGGLSGWGTMAQSGNVQEWLETASDGENNSNSEDRAIRGGSWFSTSSEISSVSQKSLPPWSDSQSQETGFRIAMVPEPSSLSLLLAGGAVLMAGRRRKRD